MAQGGFDLAGAFTAVLQAKDNQSRQAIQQQIDAFKNGDPTTALMANEQADPSVRQQAGMLVKNAFDSRDQAQAEKLSGQWMALPADLRDQCKQTALRTLVSSPLPAARAAASMMVAKIAVIELPRQSWTSVIHELNAKVCEAGAPAEVKQSCLETIGYVCHDFSLIDDVEAIVPFTDTILTAVVAGLNDPAATHGVRLAAANALFHAITFADKNFDAPQEREQIMRVVFATVQSPDPDVSHAGYQCLVNVADCHYEHLPTFMDAIFKVTVPVIKADDKESEESEAITKQAIEFWTAVCDQETDIHDTIEDQRSLNIEPTVHSHEFIAAVAEHLIPLLLQCMLRSDDEEALYDDDAWTTGMAASVCLGHMAQAITDRIVPHVMPFVMQQLQVSVEQPGKSEARHLETALLALGQILDGPHEALAPYMDTVMNALMMHAKHPQKSVRDTAVWALGTVCGYLPEMVMHGLQQLMVTLGATISDPDPNVASLTCWAIHSLVWHMVECENAEALQPFYDALLQALVQTTERPDAGQRNLRFSSYEALNMVVAATPDAKRDRLPQLVKTMLERLYVTTQRAPSAQSAEDRNELAAIQTMCCGTVQSVAKKLGGDIAPQANDIMGAIVTMLRSLSHDSTFFEEALTTALTMATCLGEHFEPYMEPLFPFMMAGLENYRAVDTCRSAVMLAGDCARALGARFAPYLDRVLAVLLPHLERADMENDVKPVILNCVGDLAMATGAAFTPHIDKVFPILELASNTDVNAADPGAVEYLMDLYESILDVCVGITQGQAECAEPMPRFAHRAHFMIAFAIHVARQSEVTSEALHVLVGLFGDLAAGAQKVPEVAQMLQDPQVRAILSAAAQHEDERVKEAAEYSHKILSAHGVLR